MSPSLSPLIFDRDLKRRQIERARPNFASHRALFDESAHQIEERIDEVKRGFPEALDLSSFPFLKTVRDNTQIITRRDLALDEEFLPFTPQSFDLITSNLSLHWVNDVPGCLTQIRQALKPGGLFIASLIGEYSLHELRSCLLEAELLVTGGISPRVSPMIDLLTASHLMQRGGFILPVADKENVTLLYPDIFALMHDLRGMAQSNAHRDRLKRPTRRAVFFEATRLYVEKFGTPEGHIPASFEIIYLHGWAPDAQV